MKKLQVFLTLSPTDKTLIGTLAENKDGCFFEYDSTFLKSPYWLSPFKLPPSDRLIKHKDIEFGPIFGLFDDSLPDGWGLLLMDRYFAKEKIPPASISVLDRLSYLGEETMGALTYIPAIEKDDASKDLISLHHLSQQSYMVMDGDIKDILPELLRAGGSPGGARPKVLVGIKNDQIISGATTLPGGFEHWLIKFSSSRTAPDEGKTEYAYSLMAKNAGIKMMDTRLFKTKEGDCFFGTKRFDRGTNNRRYHIHTFGNLIHSNFRIPSCDYKQLLQAGKILTKRQEDIEMIFRTMIFNILSCNRDDHVKNFAFMLNDKKEWIFTPAYDLTFSCGPGGEHSMTINGEGMMPNMEHCSALASLSGINDNKACNIIDEVFAAVSEWEKFAYMTEIEKSVRNRIADRINQIKKGFYN